MLTTEAFAPDAPEEKGGGMDMGAIASVMGWFENAEVP